MPLCFGADGSVRANSAPHWEYCAAVVQIFCPVMRQPPSTLVALVVRPARSEPAPGSENSWHQIISPRNVGGRNRCCCSSVPNATMDGMIHAAIPICGRFTRPEANSWAMMICSTGLDARPHGLGRCGCTQPPSAIATLRSSRGIAFSAATSARISSRSFSVSGSRSMLSLRIPVVVAVSTTCCG